MRLMVIKINNHCFEYIKKIVKEIPVRKKVHNSPSICESDIVLEIHVKNCEVLEILISLPQFLGI